RLPSVLPDVLGQSRVGLLLTLGGAQPASAYATNRGATRAPLFAEFRTTELLLDLAPFAELAFVGADVRVDAARVENLPRVFQRQRLAVDRERDLRDEPVVFARAEFFAAFDEFLVLRRFQERLRGVEVA